MGLIRVLWLGHNMIIKRARGWPIFTVKDQTVVNIFGFAGHKEVSRVAIVA